MKINHNIIKYIVRKEFIHIKRGNMLPMILVAPLIQIIIFGYVLTTEVKHIPLMILDRSNSTYSRELANKFSHTEYFNLKTISRDLSDIQPALTRGDVICALNIPADFEANIKKGRETQVQFITDGSDSNAGNMAVGYASGIIASYSAELFKEKMDRFKMVIGSIPGVSMEERVWYNPDLSNTNTMIPGIAGMILMIVTMMVAALSLVKEKENGYMEHLMVTPIKPYELLIGKIIPYILFGLLDIILITVLGILIFGIPFKGNFILLLSLSLINIFVNLGVGIFISTISATQQQAMISAIFFMFPNMLLSGFIFPIKNMPVFIQYLTYVLPLRYYMVILRGIFLKGLTFVNLLPETIALLLYAVVIFTLSVKKFRRTVG
jgi:ABC-2 type transport system permease protein